MSIKYSAVFSFVPIFNRNPFYWNDIYWTREPVPMVTNVLVLVVGVVVVIVFSKY